MIPITKNKPPKAFLEKIAKLRATPGASVDWSEIKSKQIRDSLCHEQGNLCAYCMRRISPDSSHVEHIIPQSKCKSGQDIAYNNMLAVCDGNENAGSRNALTCDRARHNLPLFVNPLKPETLTTIRYRKNGIIYSTDDNVQKDLNETLNLNCKEAFLPENRMSVIKEFNRWLADASQHGNAVSACRKKRKLIEESSNKPPFAGVLLYLLDKRIHRGN